MLCETAKPWQQGYDIAFLKSLVALFKDEFKPHSYGAFGIPNERDVADGLKNDQIVHSESGIVSYSTLKTTGNQHDFTGRTIAIPKGSLFIDACAGDCQPLVERLIGVNKNVWIEIHEENPKARQMVEDLGFCYIATKVKASSDLKGLYCRNPAYKNPVSEADRATLRTIKEGFISEDERRAILDELEQADKFWADHYSSYNKRHSWTAFALKGYKPEDPTFIIKPAEMSKKWKEENADALGKPSEWTNICHLFPGTIEVVKRIPGKKDRVRFMRLEKKGELTRHADITDREAGTADGFVSRLHIPIVTSGDCHFFAWTARGRKLDLTLQQRDLVYLDQRKPHAVKNNSPESERIHLVIDVHSGPTLRDWIVG